MARRYEDFHLLADAGLHAWPGQGLGAPEDSSQDDLPESRGGLGWAPARLWFAPGR